MPAFYHARRFAAVLPALFVLTVMQASAQSTITVATASDAGDAGDCTLREAIQAANTDAAVDACAAGSGADVIVFDAGLSGQTITLGGSQLTISTDLTIDASGLAGGIVVDGNDASRVFYVSGGTVSMEAVTITGGRASRGGGLLVSGGSATLERVTVSGNDGGDYGGGLQVNTGAGLTLRNVTVADNTTTSGGSGVWVFGGTLTAVHTTIADNSNDGVFVDWAVNATDPSVTLTNVILADNDGSDWRNPSSGGVTITRSLAEARSGDGIFDLTADPALGALADRGGPVQTMKITSATSPALDAGDSGACLAADARGTARYDLPGVANNGASTCDLGAYEHGAADAFASSNITVTTTSDEADAGNGDCTLREAIQAANTDAAVDACAAGSGADVIVFDASLSGRTVTLGGSQLTISTDLTIDASALPRGIIIDGNGASRVFYVSGGTVSMKTLTITGGNASDGGGLHLNSGSTTTLEQVTIYGNDGGSRGGGAYVTGASLTLRNVTVANNTTTTEGSGIQVNNGTLTAVNTTVAANSNDGIHSSTRYDTILLTNAILADNGSDDFSWSIHNSGTTTFSFTQSLAENPRWSGFQIVADPLLRPLADNGGPVQTMAFRSGSPALDVADSDTCPATDARGTARYDAPGSVGGGTGTCDLGAYEYGPGDDAPPFLPAVADQIVSDTDPLEVGFTLWDDEAGPVTLSVESSNPAVLPVENIVLGGAGAERTATLTATGVLGTSTVTLTADDGTAPATTSFVFKVRENTLFYWSTGDAEYYFPTTTGKHHIIDSNDIDPATFGDGVFYVELEILATGYWPGQTGFIYGVAGYPLADASFHELGARGDEWGYRGRDGRTAAEGSTAVFGSVFNNIGDRIRIWYDSRDSTLSFYTKRVGAADWGLEGGRVAHTGVVPEAGRSLRFALSGICWQSCGVEIVGTGVPPKAADATVAMTAGAAYAFTAADFRFDNQGDSDVLDRIQVVSLPAAGTLFLDADADDVVGAGEAVAAGADVSKADLDAGRFKYAPGDATAAGFTFKAHDGTAYTTDAYTMTVDATSLPVELSSFTAVEDGEAVMLRWTTASETNNAGFEVEYAVVPAVETRRGASLPWQRLAFVEGRGTTAEAQAYVYRAAGLAPGGYRFRLRQVDYDGAFAYSPEVELTVEAPRELVLAPSYPNPFNPETTIPFTVPADGRAVLAVYDVLGRRVATLFDGEAQAGRRYEVSFEAGHLTTGLYVCELRYGSRRLTRTLMLVK